MALAPWPDGPSSGQGAMFVATIRTEYRIASASPVMRFACVSDIDEYRELLQDPSCTLVHWFQPVEVLELHGGSEQAFQFVELTVDGRRRPVRRTTRTGTQLFTVSLGDATAIAGEHARHLLHISGADPATGPPAAPRHLAADQGLAR